MKTAIALLAACSMIEAQPGVLSTTPVNFQVHYLTAKTVQAKYGRKLPKDVFAGSVTAVNLSGTQVIFGQGYVLQVLRSNGFRALSQVDARAIVLKSKGAGVVAVWNKYSGTVVNVLDDVKNLQILRVIDISPWAASTLVTVDAIAHAIQPDVAAILKDVYQNYETDGIQPLMRLGPGESLVGTLLFEAEGQVPTSAPAKVFTIDVPVLK